MKELKSIQSASTSQKSDSTAPKQSFEAQFYERTGKQFNDFYAKYHTKLVWQIQKMNINSIDAEDLSNRAFMQALEKIHMYDPQYNFSTWVFDIGKKMAYQYKKDEKKREILVDMTSENSDDEMSNYDPIQNYLRSKMDSVREDSDTHHMLNLKYKETLKEISKLDPKYRQIIELSDIQGRTYNEICEELNIDLQTVKNRLHHGRLRLEKILKDKFKYITANY